MECENCGEDFNPESSRWLCPVCKTKHHCCDGAPCAVVSEEDAEG